MTLLQRRSRRRIYGRVVRQRGRHGTSRTNARSVGNYGVAVQKERHGDNRTAVRLFHALTRFTVQRGRPQVRRIDLNKKYFRIELSVTGADALRKRGRFPGDFSTESLRGSTTGENLCETIRFTPLLEKDETGTMKGIFDVFCFGRQNKVRMTLRSKEETVGEISLSDYLARTANGSIISAVKR